MALAFKYRILNLPFIMIYSFEYDQFKIIDYALLFSPNYYYTLAKAYCLMLNIIPVAFISLQKCYTIYT